MDRGLDPQVPAQMAKYRRPDEYFRRGPIEIARFGNGVLLRSSWNEEDHRNYLKRVIEHGPVSKEIVDTAVSEAVELVRRNDPLQAMRAAYNLMCLER